MLQRFTSALFGDELRRGGEREEEEEEEDDWILVNYLTGGCSSHSARSENVSRADDSEEEDEDLVMVPSPLATPPVRSPSCSSLNSMADTELGHGGAEEEEGGFLRLDASSLEESWYVTPPACFTGAGAKPLPLESSPLENLLIEHPSMSVYAHHGPAHRGPAHLTLSSMPRPLDPELDFLSSGSSVTLATSGAKEKKKGRSKIDAARHRPEVAVVQRRSACLAALLSARLLQPGGHAHRAPGHAHRAQPLSRNALRRLNLRRPPKANTTHLQQPSQRHLNF